MDWFAPYARHFPRRRIPAAVIKHWGGKDVGAEEAIRDYFDASVTALEAHVDQVLDRVWSDPRRPQGKVVGWGRDARYVPCPEEQSLRADLDRIRAFFRELDGKPMGADEWCSGDAAGPGYDPVGTYRRLRVKGHELAAEARRRPDAPWLREVAGKLLETARAHAGALLWPR